MTNSQKFVLFSIGDRGFAMASESVSELTLPQPMTTFPHTTREILGVILRRGRAIPVFDIGKLLGSQEPVRQTYQLITTHRHASGTDFAALAVTGECNLVVAEMLPATNSRLGVMGEVIWRDKTYEVLNLDKLIPAENQS